jgi:hypothetical protein
MAVVFFMGIFTCESGIAASAGLNGTLGIVPGLGHVKNGQVFEGLGWFGSIVGLMLFTNGNRYASQVGFNIWQYSMYDAYRDSGGKDTTNHHIAVFWIASFYLEASGKILTLPRWHL